MGIMSGCMFIYVRNRICIVIHPLIVCVCQCECDCKPLTDGRDLLFERSCAWLSVGVLTCRGVVVFTVRTPGTGCRQILYDVQKGTF